MDRPEESTRTPQGFGGRGRVTRRTPAIPVQTADHYGQPNPHTLRVKMARRTVGLAASERHSTLSPLRR
jgi:hypothetical protein